MLAAVAGVLGRKPTGWHKRTGKPDTTWALYPSNGAAGVGGTKPIQITWIVSEGGAGGWMVGSGCTREQIAAGREKFLKEYPYIRQIAQ